MAEQIRRLDYERRSKYKSLMKSSSGIQNIKKECSTQVRAANEMEDRKKHLYIQRNELHKRTFLERHEYERKVVEKFRFDLDLKSQNFNEAKFQLLRSKSAGPRIETDKPVVLAMLPKKYYEQTSDDSDDDNTSFRLTRKQNGTGLQKYTGHKSTTQTENSEDKLLNFTSLTAVFKFKRKKNQKPKSAIRSASFSEPKKDRISESKRFLHPTEFMGTHGQHGTDLSPSPDKSAKGSGSITAERAKSSRFRRQSEPANYLTAYIPRDVRSAPPRSSSISAAGSGEHSGPDGTPSRSYRLLKEAFKKKRKEQPNPSKDRFDKVKTDHEKRVKLLNERIKRRFNDIFAENVFSHLEL